MAKKLAEVLGRFYKSKAIGTPEFSDYCEKIWPLLATDEKVLVYNFLFHAKQWKTYLALVENDIVNSRNIDWPTFTQIINELRLLKNEQQVETYYKLAKSEGQLESFIKNYNLDKLWKKIRISRKEFIEQKKSNRILLKNNLLQEYQFAKAQRLLNKQKELLEKLKNYFPDDIDIQREVSDRNLERAKRIIEKKEINIETAKKFALSKLNLLSQEEKSLIEDLKNQLTKIKIKTSKDVENLILFMLMIEDKKTVLELVTQNYESLSPWFSLDALMQAEQYLEVINLCDQLENSISEPELHFAIKYNKALALWNLNNKDLALDIMKELVSARPNFRQSSQLLIDWSTEKE